MRSFVHAGLDVAASAIWLKCGCSCGFLIENKKGDIWSSQLGPEPYVNLNTV